MTVQPVKPADLVAANTFPDAVIEAFNETIAKHLRGNTSSFTQKEVANLIVAKGINRTDLFGNNWLDVEPLFEANGWSVTYDKPGYNEVYEPTFTFRIKK